MTHHIRLLVLFTVVLLAALIPTQAHAVGAGNNGELYAYWDNVPGGKELRILDWDTGTTTQSAKPMAVSGTVGMSISPDGLHYLVRDGQQIDVSRIVELDFFDLCVAPNALFVVVDRRAKSGFFDLSHGGDRDFHPRAAGGMERRAASSQRDSRS